MSESRLHRLGKRAKDLGQRALQELLTDEQRSEAMGMAAKGVQEGRRVLDEGSAKLLTAVGLATQPDLDRVSRKVGRLRKRLENVLDELEADEKP